MAKARVYTIDTDFDYERRDEVIEYVTNKYGAAHVSQIGTYGSMSSKSVLKVAGKLLGFDHEYINEITKQVPSHQGKTYTLTQCLEMIDPIIAYERKHPELFELALKFESLPKSAGVHACFAAGTPVRIRSGMVPIQKVQVGDEVLTHLGRYKPVVETMKTESKATLIARFSSGATITATPDHPFFARNTEDEEPSFIELRHLVPGTSMVAMPDENQEGYVWSYLLSLEESETQDVYNLTVLDDSSYTVNGLAVHNCGVLISPTPISDSIPLMVGKNGERVTQYEGPVLESKGFIKFDFLSLRNLTLIDFARDLVHKRHGIDINPEKLEPDNPMVFRTIKEGRTLGLFQIELSKTGSFSGRPLSIIM